MQTSEMARGLQIITSDQDIGPNDRIPPDDLILVNPERLTDRPLVVHHPLPLYQSGLSAASNASVDHNANSQSADTVSSSPATDELDDSQSSDIIADYGDRTESYLSYLTTSRPQPSLQETRSAGQILFTQFCRQHLPADTPLEIMEDAIPEQVESEVTQLLHNRTQVVAGVNGYAHPNLANFGRDLKRIAEQFEKSKVREDLKKKAEEVNLESIRYEDFKKLLLELFNEGISREKIVVLFFFCSDLAFRSFTAGAAHLCCQLFTWSIAFIMDYVCDWVQRQGGWAVVLGDYVPRLAVTAFALLGSIAFVIYIKRCITSP